MTQAEAELAVKGATEQLTGFGSGSFTLWVQRDGFRRAPFKIRRLVGNPSDVQSYLEMQCKLLLSLFLRLFPEQPHFLSVQCEEAKLRLNGREYLDECARNGVESDMYLRIKTGGVSATMDTISTVMLSN